jgi:PPM family protein phosphatase
MGGAVAGEVASKHAVDTQASRAASQPSEQSSAEAEAWLVESVREANRRAIELMQENTELRGMGSTLTSALVAAGSLTLAHVGDSRAYLLHEGRIRRVSVDQTWVGRLVSLGRLTQEQARRHPRRHVLLQAIGTEVEPEIQHLTLDLSVGDRFLLCSDGLTDVVEDPEIEAMLASDIAPAAQCESLVRTANERGGPDNVTVLVGHVTG